MNYEEMGALLAGRNINVLKCEPTDFEVENSRQARNFGVSGGVSTAVKKALHCDDCVYPCIINGIDKDAVRKLKKYAKDGVCPEGNLVEVMCCEGGCVGGNATLNTTKSAVKMLAEFTKESKDIEKIGENDA